MLLTQACPGCLAHASSLLADETTGTAVAVDPQRDRAQYLHDTTPHAWHIDSIFFTYCYADCSEGLRCSVGDCVIDRF